MKRLAALLLTAILIFSCPLSILAVSEGTPISSLNDLKSLEGKSGKFYLTRDITAPTNSSFSSIKDFNGTLDGNGKKIIGLNIKSDDKKAVGLFACLGASAIVKNLTLESVTIECVSNVEGEHFYIGSIAGENGGIIRNCRVSGIITVNVPASTVHVGGVTGSSQKQIKYLESYIKIGAVGSAVYAGGIAGEYNDNSADILEQCINHGNINAVGRKSTSYGGGIVGRSYRGINDCANYGSVYVQSDIDSFAAGIAGTLYGSDDVITKCFSHGKISCRAVSEQFWDAIVAARNNKHPTTIGCFYEEGSVEGKTTLQVTTAKALSSADTTTKTCFTDLDFDAVWEMLDERLNLQKITAPKPTVTLDLAQSNSNSLSGAIQSATSVATGDEYTPPKEINSSTAHSGGANGTPTNHGDFEAQKTLPGWLLVILVVLSAVGVCVFLYNYKNKN